jgi:hypothetical protein
LRETWSLDVLAEGFIDQGLIVSPMGLPHLIAKVVDDIAIQPDRALRARAAMELSWWTWDSAIVVFAVTASILKITLCTREFPVL